MAFVLDASVAAAWALDDEDHPKARDALQRLRGDGALVPALWRFEVSNFLIVNERRGRITELGSGRFLAQLARLPISVETDVDERSLVAAARSYGLSAYDAAYLDLAVRRAAPLATLDVKLAAAARKAGALVI